MDNTLEKKIIKQILWLIVAVLIYIFALAPIWQNTVIVNVPDDNTEHIWIGGNGDTIWVPNKEDTDWTGTTQGEDTITYSDEDVIWIGGDGDTIIE